LRGGGLKKIRKTFSTGTSYEIFPETLFNNVTDRKIIKKYTKKFAVGPKTFIQLREFEGFLYKISFYSVIAENLCECHRRINFFKFSIHFLESIVFADYFSAFLSLLSTKLVGGV
jgi:hypothetical protein